MIATQVLMVDHEEAMTMLDTMVSRTLVAGQFETSDAALFIRLKKALELHCEIEESLFYPELKSFPETKDLIEDSFSDHDEIKQLLNQMEPGVSSWDDQVVDLRRRVQSHAEEEERELFPRAEQLLDEEKLLRIGRLIQGMKAEQSAAA